QLLLNAAVEGEEHGGLANDLLATAQDISPSFLNLVSGSAMTIQRGAVLGAALSINANANPDYYRFKLNSGDTATVAVQALGAGNLSLELRNANDSLLAS